MPAALLAFANDWVDDKRHLRSLLDEQKAITKALAPLVRAGLDDRRHGSQCKPSMRGW